MTHTDREATVAVMNRMEKEVEYDATQWNGMLVWEAGDADIVHQILIDAFKTQREEILREAIEIAYRKISDWHRRGGMDAAYCDGLEAAISALEALL